MATKPCDAADQEEIIDEEKEAQLVIDLLRSIFRLKAPTSTRRDE